MDNYARANILITKEQDKWIRLRAAVLGVSRTEVIRQIISEKMETMPNPLTEAK